MGHLKHWMVAVAMSVLGLPTFAQAQSISAQEQAEAQLSERYAHLWAQLPATQRPAFSARERQWLNSGRWQEKDECVAERGADAGPACLLEVTLRHVHALDTGALVAN